MKLRTGGVKQRRPGCSWFHIMLLLAWLLWTLFCGTLGGPVQHATWSETDPDAPGPSFYHLPMFQQSAGPLVAPELFRPVPHRSALPGGLTVLLLPPTRQQQSVPGTGTRAVEVWCGIDQISVRVDRFQLRSWTLPTQFRLGWCEASRTSLRFLYFHSGLTECGGQSEVRTPLNSQADHSSVSTQMFTWQMFTCHWQKQVPHQQLDPS